MAGNHNGALWVIAGLLGLLVVASFTGNGTGLYGWGWMMGAMWLWMVVPVVLVVLLVLALADRGHDRQRLDERSS